MRWRLACFDLDGTLIPGTTASQHLANALGHGALVADMERRYDAGELSNRAFADAEASFYAGRSLKEVERLLDDVPLIAGIGETVRGLNALGVECVICTVAWQFAARVLAQRFGFAAASGVAMRTDADGLLTGEVARHFEEEHKVEFARSLCRERNIDLSNVFAVGDARSDLPLFAAVGFSVALNATAQARAAASTSLENSDLASVLAHVPGLLAQARSR